jgi:cell division protein FtsL
MKALKHAGDGLVSRVAVMMATLAVILLSLGVGYAVFTTRSLASVIDMQIHLHKQVDQIKSLSNLQSTLGDLTRVRCRTLAQQFDPAPAVTILHFYLVLPSQHILLPVPTCLLAGNGVISLLFLSMTGREYPGHQQGQQRRSNTKTRH